MQKNSGQLIWGAALVLMGLGVFYRIPQVMPNVEKIDFFSSPTSLMLVRISSYLLGFFLLFGGGKKIYENRSRKNSDPEPEQDSNP